MPLAPSDMAFAQGTTQNRTRKKRSNLVRSLRIRCKRMKKVAQPNPRWAQPRWMTMHSVETTQSRAHFHSYSIGKREKSRDAIQVRCRCQPENSSRHHATKETIAHCHGTKSQSERCPGQTSSTYSAESRSGTKEEGGRTGASSSRDGVDGEPPAGTSASDGSADQLQR